MGSYEKVRKLQENTKICILRTFCYLANSYIIFSKKNITSNDKIGNNAATADNVSKDGRYLVFLTCLGSYEKVRKLQENTKICILRTFCYLANSYIIFSKKNITSNDKAGNNAAPADNVNKDDRYLVFLTCLGSYEKVRKLQENTKICILRTFCYLANSYIIFSKKNITSNDKIGNFEATAA